MTAASATPFLELLVRAGARLESVTAPGPAGAEGASTERVADFGDPRREIATAEGSRVACPLLDWTAISVTGADATTFLQGQLTNDVAALGVGAVQWNAWCSPKGRMLASFPLARTGDDAFVLIVPVSLAGLVRRLRMYVLRSKVAVASLVDSHRLIGLAGAAASSDPAAGNALEPALELRYPDGRRVVVVARDAAGEWWERLRRDAVPVGSVVWDLLGIRAGVAVITPAIADRFVPQMLNWELVGGVSFRKGCYPGQEIVARMQYRGRAKERLFRARIDAQPIEPGTSLYSRRFGDQACGTVVNAAALPGAGSELLAVLQTASADGERITLSPDGAEALTLLDLPYSVDAPSQPVAG